MLLVLFTAEESTHCRPGVYNCEGLWSMSRRKISRPVILQYWEMLKLLFFMFDLVTSWALSHLQEDSRYYGRAYHIEIGFNLCLGGRSFS